MLPVELRETRPSVERTRLLHLRLLKDHRDLLQVTTTRLLTATCLRAMPVSAPAVPESSQPAL